MTAKEVGKLALACCLLAAACESETEDDLQEDSPVMEPDTLDGKGDRPQDHEGDEGEGGEDEGDGEAPREKTGAQAQGDSGADEDDEDVGGARVVPDAG